MYLFVCIGAVGFRSALYGPGDLPVLLDDVVCTGNEKGLLNCSSSPLGSHDCDHTEDASVVCNPVGKDLNKKLT